MMGRIPTIINLYVSFVKTISDRFTNNKDGNAK